VLLASLKRILKDMSQASKSRDHIDGLSLFEVSLLVSRIPSFHY
jgi:hypothetical protein